jgi:WD40 repeat protein
MLVGRATELLDLHNFQTQKSKLLTRTYRYDLATAFTPDGRIAASGDARGQVKLWKMPEGTPLPCEISLDAPITALTFDPATDRLVLGTSDGRVNVWAMDGKSPLLSWEAHQHDVRRLAVSPVDNVLVSAGRDHIVRLWNVKTGEELQRGLLGHHKPVVDAAFSVDGKNLATASLDGTVRIWSVSTGRELLVLTLPGPATGVSFLDANRLLVVGYEDQNLGFARIYPAVPE